MRGAASRHVDLVFDDAPQRYAFRYDTAVIRSLIPAGRSGVYMLYVKGEPRYVGRSDRCLRRRLLDHNLRSTTTHVCWEMVTTAEMAYRLESIWFHDLPPTSRRNLIHPARPAQSSLECPGCWADQVYPVK